LAIGDREVGVCAVGLGVGSLPVAAWVSLYGRMLC
jgi:hypothetical protein